MKGLFKLQKCLRRWFVRKIFGSYTRNLFKKKYCLFKKDVFLRPPAKKTGLMGSCYVPVDNPVELLGIPNKTFFSGEDISPLIDTEMPFLFCSLPAFGIF